MFFNAISLEKYRFLITFIIKTVLGSLFLAISAQITIPLPLVPITGQTLGLTIVAISLGRKSGVAAILLYLLEGCLGLPVFAGGAFGIGALLGPSGGYLLGFIPAAFIMGYFGDNKCLNSFLKTSIAVTLGTITVIVFGLFQLSFFVPAESLLNIGFYPFILGGIVKSIIASLLLPSTYRFFNKNQ